MFYIILAFLLVSALCAILFWFALIAAKRKDGENPVDSPEENEDKQIYDITDDLRLMNATSSEQLPK